MADPTATSRELVRHALAGALERAGLDRAKLPAVEEIEVDRPDRPDHGDYATNLALKLAKPLGRPPRDIAQLIVDALSLIHI